MNLKEYFAKALESYQQGRLHEAENICQSLLTVYPQDVNALYLMGMIKLKFGDYDASIEYLKNALEIMPTYAEGHYAMGDALRQKGLLDSAIASFEKAVHLRPDFTDGYFTMGNTYEEKHKFREAASCYRDAVKINPNHHYAHARLGFALYNTRDFSEAIKHLKMALEINPQYDEAYICLGMISREKENYDEAIDYFKKALAVNPQSAWIYTNIGVTLQQRGQYEEGEKYLQEALKKNSNIHDPQRNLDNLLMHGQKSPADKMKLQNKNMNKILIGVAAFNRKKITDLSLAQTKRYKTASCHLQVYNDHSSEYDNAFLSLYADEVIQLPNKMGIDKLRWCQFRRFLESDFDFLYLTDNDVIHDPDYVSMLEKMYAKGKGMLPVSLFNNIFMLQPRLILSYEQGIFLKSSAPGASMFFDRNMVEKILLTSSNIGNLLDYLPWDNKAIACLRLPWITPEISYLEHFGAGGLNNDNYERERAVNPTDYLRERRGPILRYLAQYIDIGPDIRF
ncbi:MAG: tetratricopeptide repeat protein [Thermodesulfovibrionales bacterium]|nr:tetratricopeptide repeat protein [Thermodesulfovibrionales bacterium]